ncbi:MAG: ribosome maturation factor RimP [candidate division Zixibacteria bacterium]|nr:ribosome maturation factor RimP [candidate division Zixibacteria bacterium]
MVPERDEILKVVTPIVQSQGFELVDLTVSASRRPVLRIYIHKPGGVTVDDCADISRAVGIELDTGDVFEGRYFLEVSSPGLDRPLKTIRDFQRNVGSDVKLTITGDNGKNAEIKGKLQECGSDRVVLDINGEAIGFDFEKLIQGKLIY